MISSLQRRIIRTITTRYKLPLDVDKQVLEAIEENKLKARKHPGILKNNTVYLPKEITKAIRFVLKDDPWPVVYKESHQFARYLKSRHLPPEKALVERKTKEAEDYVNKKYNLDLTTVNCSDKEREELTKKSEKKLRKTLQQRLYNWKPIEYNAYKVKLYLTSRAAAEYAAISKIFLDMKQMYPDFEPKTIFDFGSGVGTVTWAARSIWQDSIKEYYCVDASSIMNDFAAIILKGGDENKDMPLRGIFYRQFLPVTHILTYDIVISAYSLFEMPSLQSRLETILALWKKTKDYLVIIEQGTNAGFQIINEARDFILEYSNNKSSNSYQAHICAPCPHDKECPRFAEDWTPCNFIVPYNTFKMTDHQTVSKEIFSYIVIQKGPRNHHKPQWPRIVRETLPRSKHVVCRVCTSQGKLKEIVFTASKHGKVAYRCAKVSKWGDLLPVSLKEEDQQVDSSKDDV